MARDDDDSDDDRDDDTTPAYVRTSRETGRKSTVKSEEGDGAVPARYRREKVIMYGSCYAIFIIRQS